MILDRIQKPTDIMKLSNKDLETLAAEVRQIIIEVVLKNGGHLAPSLGTVELTIALLSVFDALKDRIVFDVGHQSYAFKILTDRKERFHTLRQLDGISGFSNIRESPYDAFSTGHSSTSISAALGIAAARDLNNEDGHSIAVIGDGALTGGISFEALNHSGHLQKNKLIVVLNDNAMSISKNVGGLQRHMANMYSSKGYNALKQQIWDLSSSLPSSIRRRFIYGAQKLEESMMNILVPNIIFEDLGFKYVGPIDGHDTPNLISILRRVKNNMVGPVLVHIVTQKGRGYAPAESDSSLFHGVGPYNPKKKPSACQDKDYNQVFGETLCEMAKEDDKVVAITAAMSVGTGLADFEKKYPERFFDVGIAEQHAITMAAAMTTKGIKPFVAIYSTFTQRALDQIIHDVALPKLPVVICLDRAGFVGEDGATHHGAFDIAYLSFIPNMTVLAPSSAEELSQMLKWAKDHNEGPVAIRYPRGKAFCSGVQLEEFEPGKALLMPCSDDNATIGLIGIGDALAIAEDTMKLLKEKGYKVKLLNLRSIKPLDIESLQKLANGVSYIFSFESGSILGGAGAHIAQMLCNKDVKVINFGYPDEFVPHGDTALLNQRIGFTAEELTKKILALL